MIFHESLSDLASESSASERRDTEHHEANWINLFYLKAEKRAVGTAALDRTTSSVCHRVRVPALIAF